MMSCIFAGCSITTMMKSNFWGRMMKNEDDVESTSSINFKYIYINQ